MAKKLQKYEWRKRGARSSKYPWDEWFDGAIWQITEKDDLNGVKVESFTSSVQNAAKRRGQKVRMNVYKDEGRLVLQAY